MSDQHFHDFIKPILEWNTFHWFAHLGYVPAQRNRELRRRKEFESIWALTDPTGRWWRKVPETAWDCFHEWRYDQYIGSGADPCLWLEEQRPNGDVRFHVLVAQWNGFEEQAIWMWKKLSSGWAFSHPLEKATAGFLGHMVMRAGCTLVVDLGGRPSQHYTSEDFIPWRPKD